MRQTPFATQLRKPNFSSWCKPSAARDVLSAADLSAATKPATQPSDSAQPSAPAAAPAEARETASAALAGREAYPSPQNATKPMAAEAPKPAPPAVIPAVAPVRVFPVDPPKTGGLELGLRWARSRLRLTASSRRRSCMTAATPMAMTSRFLAYG